MNLLNIKQVKKSQRGISLFDFVLWFAIAGAFLAAIYAIFAPSRAQVRAQNLFIEIQSSQTAIRTAFAGKSDFYTALDQGKLITSKIVPTSIKGTNTAAFSTEGGAISIASSDSGATFTITYNAMPTTVSNMLIGKLNMDDWTAVKGGDASGSKDCKADINNCLSIDPSATPNVKLVLTAN